MKRSIFYYLLIIIINSTFIKAQIFNVTQTNFNNGPGSFYYELMTNAMPAVNAGNHAIININAPGLITTAPLPVNNSWGAIIKVTSNGTLTIRKDPSLPSNNVQGFVNGDFFGKGFRIENVNSSPANPTPNPNSKVEFIGIAMSQFAYSLWFQSTRNCLIENCTFTNNQESVHASTCETMTITNNIFNEVNIPNTQQSLANTHIHIHCNDNNVDFNNNQFDALYSSGYVTAVFIDMNPAAVSLAANQNINIKGSSNVFSNCKIGIYSSLKPANDTYNGTTNFNFSNNQFTNNYDHFYIVNPNKTTVLNSNTFLNAGYNDFSIEFKPLNISNTSNYGLNLVSTNSIGVPVFNNTNIFSGSTSSVYRSFKIFGQPTGVYNIANSINLIGLNLPGRISVETAKKVNIRETAITTNIPNLPIDHGTGNTGNAGIGEPTIMGLQIVGSQLNVDYFLIGNQHSNLNAPLTVEFFKCDANGNLVSFIGNQVINSVTSSLINASLPLSSPLVSGQKIGMTVSSPGTSNIDGLGTSKVSYFSLACCSSNFISGSNFISFSYAGPSTPNFYNSVACRNSMLNFNTFGCASNTNFVWDFGDGSPQVSGSNVSHQFVNPGNYFVTVTTTGQACVTAVNTILVRVICCGGNIIAPSGCVNTPVALTWDCFNVPVPNDPNLPVNPNFNWNFGDGGTGTGIPATHVYSAPGTYNITLTMINPFPQQPVIVNTTINITDCQTVNNCKDCIGSFSPEAGEYILSLWVKEDHPTSAKTYPNTGAKISFIGSSSTYGPFYPNLAKNKIIDGWQRIEEKFTVPVGATSIKIELVNNNLAPSGIDSYYDDIRIHPVNGNMKSYVYDPVTLRLSAELDENNYATFYEYDEEGKLIRVKKETERGIMTIKEAKNNTKKK